MDSFSLGIYIPDFLKWGDVSLSATLSGRDVVFISPRTMSGLELNKNEVVNLKNEFEKIRQICNQKDNTVFISL